MLYDGDAQRARGKEDAQGGDCGVTDRSRPGFMGGGGQPVPSYRAHVYKGPKPGLMFCYCRLETQYIFNRASHFHFALCAASKVSAWREGE